jgi:hypothetical protein
MPLDGSSLIRYQDLLAEGSKSRNKCSSERLTFNCSFLWECSCWLIHFDSIPLIIIRVYQRLSASNSVALGIFSLEFVPAFYWFIVQNIKSMRRTVGSLFGMKAVTVLVDSNCDPHCVVVFRLKKRFFSTTICRHGSAVQCCMGRTVFLWKTPKFDYRQNQNQRKLNQASVTTSPSSVPMPCLVWIT